jgi:hypothetical protein
VPHDNDHGAIHVDVATGVVIVVDGLDRLLDGNVGPLTAREPLTTPKLAAVGDAMAAVTAASSSQSRA